MDRNYVKLCNDPFAIMRQSLLEHEGCVQSLSTAYKLYFLTKGLITVADGKIDNWNSVCVAWNPREVSSSVIAYKSKPHEAFGSYQCRVK